MYFLLTYFPIISYLKETVAKTPIAPVLRNTQLWGVSPFARVEELPIIWKSGSWSHAEYRQKEGKKWGEG